MHSCPLNFISFEFLLELLILIGKLHLYFFFFLFNLFSISKSGSCCLYFSWYPEEETEFGWLPPIIKYLVWNGHFEIHFHERKEITMEIKRKGDIEERHRNISERRSYIGYVVFSFWRDVWMEDINSDGWIHNYFLSWFSYYHLLFDVQAMFSEVFILVMIKSLISFSSSFLILSFSKCI